MFRKKESKKERLNENNKDNNDVKKEKSIKFYNLSPDEINNDSIYLKALDQKIKDEKVLNIAITGRYGAGKTSVIRTYQKMHPENDYLNISLASFKNKGQDNNANIERSILQQLFYSVNPFRIPNSRFKRIKNIKNEKILEKIFIFLGLIFMIIIPIYILSHPQYINKDILIVNLEQIQKIYFSGKLKGSFSTLLFIILDVGIIGIIWLVVKRIMLVIEISNIKLKKESIEVEINNNNASGDSIFNKYIDEIIYFFEVTKYNVVVIEDLDRFENSNEVFTKLRELNQIINGCETIKQKVKFVYAIKDETFDGKDRIKFFDFIIPIIPIINSSNSMQKLVDKLEENNMSEIFDRKYIRQITLYIDDMRLLNNIMNEFNIYIENLNLKNLSKKKLFSIITFKNIYPEEFAKLQDNKSIINDIFETKDERVKKYVKNLVNRKEGYQDRLKELSISESTRNSILQKISDINIKIEKTKKIKFIDEILLNCGVENILLEEERKNKLIVFLLSNGYLQEDYQEYINYFYQGVLKQNDKEFLISINSHQKLTYDYKLCEIKEIIDSLSLENFEQKEILNFNLLDYILTEGKKYIKELILILGQLSKGDDDDIEFCIEYIKRDKNVRIFVRSLCRVWKEVLEVLENSATEDIKEIFIYNILKYVDIEDIENLKNMKYLKKYISETPSFIKKFTSEEEIEKMKSIFTHLDVRLRNIDFKSLNTTLEKYIMKNNLFEIDQHMIEEVIESQNLENIKHGENNEEKFNFEFGKYLTKDTLKYVSKIYQIENGDNANSKEVVEVLKNKSIASELKMNILMNQKLRLENIADVEIGLWDIVIENNKLLANWNNVLLYYSKKGFNDKIMNYIVRNFDEIIKDDTEIPSPLINILIKNLTRKLAIILLESQVNNASDLNIENCIKIILYKDNRLGKMEYKFEKDDINMRLYNIIKNNQTHYSAMIIDENSKQYIIITRKTS